MYFCLLDLVMLSGGAWGLAGSRSPRALARLSLHGLSLSFTGSAESLATSTSPPTARVRAIAEDSM